LGCKDESATHIKHLHLKLTEEKSAYIHRILSLGFLCTEFLHFKVECFQQLIPDLKLSQA